MLKNNLTAICKWSTVPSVETHVVLVYIYIVSLQWWIMIQSLTHSFTGSFMHSFAYSESCCHLRTINAVSCLTKKKEKKRNIKPETAFNIWLYYGMQSPNALAIYFRAKPIRIAVSLAVKLVTKLNQKLNKIESENLAKLKIVLFWQTSDTASGMLFYKFLINF